MPIIYYDFFPLLVILKVFKDLFDSNVPLYDVRDGYKSAISDDDLFS